MVRELLNADQSVFRSVLLIPAKRMNQLGSSKSVTLRNGHRLCYQLRGNGPHAILCIPGALGTALIHFLPQSILDVKEVVSPL